MGRPLNKRLFGANERNNIKVQFNNGDASVPGYIVKQKGSKRFLCKDANGNYAWCHLVDKASADLQQHEMTITVKYDNGDVNQITKIAAHRVTVDGTIQPWSFSTSTSDGKVQMEEAGTDFQLTGATDLEGDDFNFLTMYPEPFSGDYKTAAVALSAISWSERGTPFEPGSSQTGLGSNQLYTSGLRRDKYLGNFTTNGSTAPASWNYSWFNTATAVPGAEIFDPAMSFGAQSDNTTLGPQGGGESFSLQWWGYVKVPVSQKYNFYLTSDDHFGMWIGDAAVGTPSNTNRLVASNAAGLQGLQTHTNSLILDAGKYYPVRFWFSEHSGSCKAQVFAIGENGIKLNGDDLTWLHSSQGLY
jgi:hypothetical protein